VYTEPGLRNCYSVCLFVGVASFRNYMHSGAVNKVIKDVEFYKRKRGIAGCCV
jgi:hypothetical protein